MTNDKYPIPPEEVKQLEKKGSVFDFFTDFKKGDKGSIFGSFTGCGLPDCTCSPDYYLTIRSPADSQGNVNGLTISFPSKKSLENFITKHEMDYRMPALNPEEKDFKEYVKDIYSTRPEKLRKIALDQPFEVKYGKFSNFNPSALMRAERAFTHSNGS